MTKNTIKHNYKISSLNRQKLLKQNSFLVWFTGLSGSGKSTIANALEVALHEKELLTYTLDGDNIRQGINKDLSFSSEDRTENIRRIAEIANLMIDSGVIVLAAFVSPYRKDRENIKNIVKTNNFVEVFIDTSLEECEKRDVKGLYKKARAGEITNMTGISAPYEKPLNPDIVIKTETETIDQAVDKIISYLTNKITLTVNE